MRHLYVSLTLAAMAVGTLVASPAQTTGFLPIDEVRPGMVGVGRTVFAGEKLEEFRATIIGVLRNVMGPRRDLILAKLEGGPLANTGVIQGMSGSPVYVEGRLVGAVSYSLGSFPKEPIAGITPIEEMTADVSSQAPRVSGAGLAITWPATTPDIFAALSRVAARALSPLGTPPRDLRVVGPQSLADLAPALRPIGAAMVMSGFEPALDRELRQILTNGSPQQTSTRNPPGVINGGRLRPGDPVGMSLVRGDYEMGATGTVTHVDGDRVYAFGHPFLNLGPATLAMTQAHVYTVLPSLDSSMKIARMGPVIGTITQDRATAVGGTLGPGPSEMEVRMAITSDRAPARQFSFHVLHDESLTPLFGYVAVLNSLLSYERQTGAMSIATRGTLSFGSDGELEIDDVFTGDGAAAAAAAAAVGPVGTAITNDFRRVMPQKLDLQVHASEIEKTTTIERAWLDTTRPRFGGTHNLQVQLQDYRGDKRVVSMPITMPLHADGPVTIMVSDAPTLTSLEGRELRPARPASWPDVMNQLRTTRRNNRLYVRIIGSSAGTVVAGDTLSALPASVQSALQSDSTAAHRPVSRTVVGSWEQRLDMAVRGSRELTVTLRPAS
jgi:hypothetical protein